MQNWTKFPDTNFRHVSVYGNRFLVSEFDAKIRDREEETDTILFNSSRKITVPNVLSILVKLSRYCQDKSCRNGPKN
jgi:hypothetical protein